MLISWCCPIYGSEVWDMSSIHLNLLNFFFYHDGFCFGESSVCSCRVGCVILLVLWSQGCIICMVFLTSAIITVEMSTLWEVHSALNSSINHLSLHRAATYANPSAFSIPLVHHAAIANCFIIMFWFLQILCLYILQNCCLIWLSV